MKVDKITYKEFQKEIGNKLLNDADFFATVENSEFSNKNYREIREESSAIEISDELPSGNNSFRSLCIPNFDPESIIVGLGKITGVQFLLIFLITTSLGAFFVLPNANALGYKEISILSMLGIFLVISLIAYISYRCALPKTLTIRFYDNKISNKKYTCSMLLGYTFTLIDLIVKSAIIWKLFSKFDELESSAAGFEQNFIPILILLLLLLFATLAYKFISLTLSQIRALVFCRK